MGSEMCSSGGKFWRVLTDGRFAAESGRRLPYVGESIRLRRLSGSEDAQGQIGWYHF